MTKGKLEKAGDLYELIVTTKRELKKLNHWINLSGVKNIGGHYDNDYNYNLTICEHSDGSGSSINLNRYFGNTALLNMIANRLERQLHLFETEFANL